MNQQEAVGLLLEALEHERGGVQVYEMALQCVQNRDLGREWTRYLEETRQHAAALVDVLGVLGVDPEQTTPARTIVREMALSLVAAMKKAKAQAGPAVAQLVACECVTLAETKDHANWDLLRHAAENMRGAAGRQLREACERIHVQEGEHLFHTKGWGRELWLQKLGIDAMLPPPEEETQVPTAIGAARVPQEGEQAG